MEGPHSEASRLLEAALEQMDGIIQGAKFDLPNDFYDESSRPSSGPTSRPSSASIPEALSNLKNAILNNPNSASRIHSIVDKETQAFLLNWLKNNGLSNNGHVDEDSGIDDRLMQIESEKDALQLQVSILTEEIDRQTLKISELEQVVATKTELVKRTEQILEKEIRLRTTLETQRLDQLSELSILNARCANLERENHELRRGTPDRPRHLGVSSSSPMSTPDDDLSPTSRKGVAFSDKEEDIPHPTIDSDLDTSYTSAASATRPPRGLKRILGKIKRSNSGGHLEDGRRPQTPEFRRGGMRATVSGRLTGWGERNFLRKQPFSEWNVDTICTWLECLGLGMYNTEVQKQIGMGEQLLKFSALDLESRLGVKNPLHRKKLLLAMSARQDPSRPDREGNLDGQWVLRWLDDVGLPQYKDAFAEARVDGRVLNLLTVDDLFLLKVTNQLHHISLKRGIQILRQLGFDPDSLKRRAVPGESCKVVLWTNHRVMEWLKEVDLSEYAPNLRGSGVHGALMIFENKFNDELLAALLSIPPNKTLLRRHLSIHFKELVGREIIQEKRSVESETGFIPLTPTAKAKSKQHGQFTLKRKKSKSHIDFEDLLCPFPKT